jgi:hypothetical protein
MSESAVQRNRTALSTDLVEEQILRLRGLEAGTGHGQTLHAFSGGRSSVRISARL